PRPEDHQGTFLQDRLKRVRWSLLQSPSTAQIVELNDMGEPEWRPLFGEPNQALAEEPLTYPPQARMLVLIDLVNSCDYWQDACAQDDRPAPLIIQNSNGQPITLAQFIKELH
ncbi:hypothetical protein GQ44DRAFT_570101, partial [Phaeosphaeriaceae sp. PMI808]